MYNPRNPAVIKYERRHRVKVFLSPYRIRVLPRNLDREFVVPTYRDGNEPCNLTKGSKHGISTYELVIKCNFQVGFKADHPLGYGLQNDAKIRAMRITGVRIYRKYAKQSIR